MAQSHRFLSWLLSRPYREQLIPRRKPDDRTTPLRLDHLSRAKADHKIYFPRTSSYAVKDSRVPEDGKVLREQHTSAANDQTTSAARRKTDRDALCTLASRHVLTCRELVPTAHLSLKSYRRGRGQFSQSFSADTSGTLGRAARNPALPARCAFGLRSSA